MSWTIAQWTKLIAEAVTQIADRSYQERTWFGNSHEINSPDEMFCRLFDDLDFEEYLKSAPLTPLQKKLGEALNEGLRSYGEKTPAHLDPGEVFKDSDWESVRHLAAQFAEVLSTEREPRPFPTT